MKLTWSALEVEKKGPRSINGVKYFDYVLNSEDFKEWACFEKTDTEVLRGIS